MIGMEDKLLFYKIKQCFHPNNDKITVFNTDLFCLNLLKLIAVDKSIKSAII